MIEIDCTGCRNHCCGGNPNLTPVLLLSEEVKFKSHSRIVQTPHREMHILGKKDNGNCLFLDDQTTMCTIYRERPLECMLYPFVLDFAPGKPDIKLDERFCPQRETLKFDKEDLAALINKQSFPEDWIKAYGSLTGF